MPMSDLEINVLTDLMETNIQLNKNLAQLAMTTTAERELYRQRVDVCQSVLDHLA
jgi:hypothetical protein